MIQVGARMAWARLVGKGGVSAWRRWGISVEDRRPGAGGDGRAQEGMAGRQNGLGRAMAEFGKSLRWVELLQGVRRRLNSWLVVFRGSLKSAEG